MIFDRWINIWENELGALQSGKPVKPVFSSPQFHGISRWEVTSEFVLFPMNLTGLILKIHSCLQWIILGSVSLSAKLPSSVLENPAGHNGLWWHCLCSWGQKLLRTSSKLFKFIILMWRNTVQGRFITASAGDQIYGPCSVIIKEFCNLHLSNWLKSAVQPHQAKLFLAFLLIYIHDAPQNNILACTTNMCMQMCA